MTALEERYRAQCRSFLAKHNVIGSVRIEDVWQTLGSAEIEALEAAVSTNRLTYQGKLIHSERDPEREARRTTQQFVDAGALICISTGAGFLLGSLPPSIKHVLIIEPKPYCLAMLMLAGYFVSFRGHITLFADPLDLPDALENILPWLQGKNLKQTHIYAHAPMLSVEAGIYTRAFERVKILFEKRSVNQATIVKFQQLWNKNIILNQRAISVSATLNDLLAQPPPKTIVIAGAGPSLAHSLADLKKFREHFVLFAADTAFMPLAQAGIFPDLVLAADPQWVNHYFVQSTKIPHSQWALDPVVCPSIPQTIINSGGRILFWNNVFAVDDYFRSADRGDVQHGGSVSTNAYDIAYRWLLSEADLSSPARLILIGQDLAFSNKQAHCKGAALEAQIYMRQNRTFCMESHNLRQMRALPVLYEKGIRQKRVRTNAKLRIFLEWFSARAATIDREKIRLINATHDGAEIRGFEHMNLEQALEGVGNERDVNLSINAGPEKSLAEKAAALQVSLAGLKGLLRESVQLARELNPKPATLARLNANDAKLSDFGAAKDIVGLNAQALILRITEQGEEVDAAEFYRAMYNSAREIGHWVAKIVHRPQGPELV
jgi:hypothetical protein